LVAVWREALLARAVLRGLTRGYRRHPQLDRFRAARRPLAVLDAYLWQVYREARRRGYRFDRTRIGSRPSRCRILVTEGQVAFEWLHLQRKLRKRDPARYRECRRRQTPEVHPVFRVVTGTVEIWERGNI
jgi:hypothetical protein